jgi:hypothetical protein
MYQFEPTSTAEAESDAGMVIGGGAVPNRSAATAGVDASTMAASATAEILFIGSIPIKRRRRNASSGQGGISPTNLNLDLTLTL